MWGSYVNGCCFWQESLKWVTFKWCFLTSGFIHVERSELTPKPGTVLPSTCRDLEMVVGIKTDKGRQPDISRGHATSSPELCLPVNTEGSEQWDHLTLAKKKKSRVHPWVLALLWESRHKYSEIWESLERETCHTKGSGFLSGTLSAFSNFEFETPFPFRNRGWKTKSTVELSRKLNKEQAVKVFDPKNALSSGL